MPETIHEVSSRINTHCIGRLPLAGASLNSTMRNVRAERAARLRGARTAKGYPSAAAFAAAHDDEIVESTYRSHENGTRTLTEAAARQYAALMDVTWQSLMYGDEPDGSEAAPPSARDLVNIAGQEYALLPVYDLRLSAGPGAWNDGRGDPLFYEPHRFQWLRSLSNAAPEMLALARVEGDSMEKTLRAGDQVLLDRTRRRATVDGIYGFRRGDEMQVKRIAADPRTGLLTIISDNTEYPRWDGVNPDEIEIIGRVIWLGRRV